MAKVKLGLDDSELTTGLSRAGKNIQGFAAKAQASTAVAGGGLMKAFAFLGGASAIKGFASEMGNVVDLATRFGTTAESIQRVGNSAQLAGTDIESVAKLMSKLTIEAAKGSKEMEALGISSAAFANANLEDQVIMLAGAYEQANGDQTKMVQLMSLLGNRGQQILPMLSAGVAGLRDEFGRMPVVLEDSAKAMAAFDDMVDLSVQQFKWGIGVMIKEVLTLHQGIMALSKSGFNGDKFKEEFEKIKKAEDAAAEEKRPKRKEFDPDAFAAGTGKVVQTQQAKDEADQRKREAIAILNGDLAIADAKAKGNDKLAAQLERQKAIRAEAIRIMNETGLDPNAAVAAAAKMNADPMAGDESKKGRIKGYTGGAKSGESLSKDTGFLGGGTFKDFFHPDSFFDKKDLTTRNSDDFNQFFHGKGPQRQTAQARETRDRENRNGNKDSHSILEAQLKVLETLASY
jgi:hypothetical protein